MRPQLPVTTGSGQPQKRSRIQIYANDKRVFHSDSTITVFYVKLTPTPWQNASDGQFALGDSLTVPLHHTFKNVTANAENCPPAL